MGYGFQLHAAAPRIVVAGLLGSMNGAVERLLVGRALSRTFGTFVIFKIQAMLSNLE